MSEYWYRYDDKPWYFSDGLGPARGVRIVETRERVVKHTPCGVWLYSSNPKYGRWVSNTARRRWAYPTREEAWNSFRIRKERQCGYLSAQLKQAQAARKAAREEDVPGPGEDVPGPGEGDLVTGRLVMRLPYWESWLKEEVG